MTAAPWMANGGDALMRAMPGFIALRQRTVDAATEEGRQRTSA